jgi:hypothetical protein
MQPTEKIHERDPLNSSARLGCADDPQRQLLWILSTTGERYFYQMVPADVVDALVLASFQGQYFDSGDTPALFVPALILALMKKGYCP